MLVPLRGKHGNVRINVHGATGVIGGVYPDFIGCMMRQQFFYMRGQNQGEYCLVRIRQISMVVRT